MNVDALKSSFFKLLPEDQYPHLLSFLDARSLGQVALVCRLFKRVSEDNNLWKRFFAKTWNVPKIEGPLLTRQWKNYYERRNALSAEHAHPSQALLWGYGLHFTALQAENRALWRAAYSPILGIPPPANDNKTQSALSQALANILSLYFQNTQDAFALYLKHRSELIKRAPVIGAWLSMLFHASKTIEVLKEQKIFFPSQLREPEEHRYFLQGTAIAWLERGRHKEALITLQCLAQMRLRETGLSDSDGFFAAFVIQGHREKSTALSEGMADFLSEIPSHMCLVLDIYNKTYHSAACPTMQVEMRLAEKICRVLISAHRHDLSVPKEIFAIPLKVFQKYVTSTKELFSPEVLTAFFEMAWLYDCKPFYGLLVRESKLEGYQNQTSSEAQRFYSVKMKLCEKAKDIPEAVNAWIMLCQCLSCHLEDMPLEEREDIFHRIYKLIDENPAAGSILRNIDSNSKLVRVGIAYALYRNAEIDKALQTMIELMPLMATDDIDWIHSCSRTSFKAVLIYSLALDSESDLEDYYMDMLDYYPKMAGYIYHNLATRLYFEGRFPTALKIIQLAEQESFDEPEMWVVKGLCYQATHNLKDAQQCFHKAHKINPSFHSARCYDRQIDLLIFLAEQQEEEV